MVDLDKMILDKMIGECWSKYAKPGEWHFIAFEKAVYSIVDRVLQQHPPSNKSLNATPTATSLLGRGLALAANWLIKLSERV